MVGRDCLEVLHGEGQRRTSDERQSQRLDPDVPGPQGRVTKERLAERVDRKGAHALGHSAVADVIRQVVEI